MGLACVAEGVEDGDVLETLAGLGCQQAQGYFISRPMPCDAFDQWLAARGHRAELAREALDAAMVDAAGEA